MKGIFFQNGFLNRNNLKKCLIENIHSTKTNKVAPSQRRMNKSPWRNSSYMKVHSPNTPSLLRWEIKTLKLFSTQKRNPRRLKLRKLKLKKRKLSRKPKRSQKPKRKPKRQTRTIHLEMLNRLGTLSRLMMLSHLMTANYVGLRANLRLATHQLRPSQDLLLMR